MDEKGLGKQLQAARQAAGLTQQQLCHQANLSFSTLTKIERGAIKAPSIFTIQAIAGALDLSLDELVGPAKPLKQLKKTKNGASFIYFDVNGCLIHYYQRAFGRLAALHNAPSDTVEAVYWHYNSDICRGELSLSDFNAKLAERLGVEAADWGEAYLEAVEPVAEMQELIQWASQHYKIGLMTNIMPGLLSGLRRKGLVPDLDYAAIIDSSEVGAIKPETKVYEIAHAKAGVPTEEILLIDDDRTNLMAAEKLGWRVVWFDDSMAAESSTRVREALEPA